MGDSEADSAAGPHRAGSSDSVRLEAERLVATVLGGFAAAFGAGAKADQAGAAECQFCPLCRSIAAIREPRPEFAEQLATAAGDLAVGLAGLLRAFATAAGTRAPDGTTVAGPGVGRDTADEVWREATRTRHDSWPATERVAPATVSGAGAEAAPGSAVPPADAAGPARVPQPSEPPEPADAEPRAATGEPSMGATRRRVPASRARRRVTGAADDGPDRRD